MGRLRKPKGPRKRGGRIDHPDLFEWAESVAARLAALLADVSALSRTAASASFCIFLPMWLTSSEDAALRPAFAIAATVALICTSGAWLTYLFRNYMSQRKALALHGSALCGIGLTMLLVVVAGWHQDSVRSSARAQQRADARSDQDLSTSANEESQRQTQIVREAVERALAAKDEAAREAATLAEAQCLQSRDDAIDKASKAQSSARRAAEDCRAQYNEQLFTFKPYKEYCQAAIAHLDNARYRLNEAKGKSCSSNITGSIPTGR